MKSNSIKAMLVRVIHSDGSSTYTLQNTQFAVSVQTLTISDSNLVLSLSSRDKISINDQPKNAAV